MKGKLKFDVSNKFGVIGVVIFSDNNTECKTLRLGFLNLDDATEYLIDCELIFESLINEEQLEPHLPEYDIVYTDLEKVKAVHQVFGNDGTIWWRLNPDIEEVGSIYESEIVAAHLRKRQEGIVSDISQSTRELLFSKIDRFFSH